MMIEDWEIGELYWKCLAKHIENEAKAIKDLKMKFLGNLAKTKDLHLFLGTTFTNHFVSINPFIIIGSLYPKIDLQGSLF